MVVKRFDVYLINLDPTVGREIKKTRPCLVISPDEMNQHIATIIVAPMTTQGKAYPTIQRASLVNFKEKTARSSSTKFERLIKRGLSNGLGSSTHPHKKLS